MTGDAPGRPVTPVADAYERLAIVGIGLRRIAVICGVRADCGVWVAETSYQPGAHAGSVRILEAHLRIPDATQRAFLAVVLRLLPTGPGSANAGGALVWRGWLTGEYAHQPISLTLTASPDLTTEPSALNRCHPVPTVEGHTDQAVSLVTGLTRTVRAVPVLRCAVTLPDHAPSPPQGCP
jgi:hypothetical protein